MTRPLLLAALMLLGIITVADAQSTRRSPYDRLEPGHRKIAQALFAAQALPAADTTAAPLTLDQIAARRLSGQDWGRIFKDMKKQGLITDRNLARSMTRLHAAPTPTASVATQHAGASGALGRGQQPLHPIHRPGPVE